MQWLEALKDEPGVYLFLDLDGEPLYVGKTSKMRERLTQHFIRQDSSAVADGLLDLYDVWQVCIWYVDGGPEEVAAAEAHLYADYKPRWNRGVVSSKPTPSMSLALKDATVVSPISSAAELDARREPLTGIEAKLHYLSGRSERRRSRAHLRRQGRL